MSMFNNTVEKQVKAIVNLYVDRAINDNIMEILFNEVPKLDFSHDVLYKPNVWSPESTVKTNLTVEKMDSMILDILNAQFPTVTESYIKLLGVHSGWDSRGIEYLKNRYVSDERKGNKNLIKKLTPSHMGLVNDFIRITFDHSVKTSDRYHEMVTLLNSSSNNIFDYFDFIAAFNHTIRFFIEVHIKEETYNDTVKKYRDIIEKLFLQKLSFPSIQAYKELIELMRRITSMRIIHEMEKEVANYLIIHGQKYCEHIPDHKFSFPLPFESFIASIA